MNDFIDKHFYFVSFCIGFLTISIFDYSAITDDIFIFVFISPVVAPFIGALVMIGLALLRGVVALLGDFIYLISKTQKII